MDKKYMVEIETSEINKSIGAKECRLPTYDEAVLFEDEGKQQFNDLQNELIKEAWKTEAEPLKIAEEFGDGEAGLYALKIAEIKSRYPKV